MKCLSLLAMMMVPAALPTVLAAQEFEWVLAGGVYNPGGGDFEATETGPGIDVVVRRASGDHLRLGGGVQWNQNGVQFVEDDWSTWSFFIEAHLDLTRGESRVVPFVAGRGAWITQSIDTSGGERSVSGWGVGGLVGATISLTPSVGLEIALPLYQLSLGDYALAGVSVADTESSGRLLGLRLGVVIGY